MFAKFCQWMFKLFGWKVIYDLPKMDKYVLIAAPHTSNWDFIIGIMAKFSLKLKLNFLGKGSLFKGPFAWFFKVLGGIPVYRSQRLNMVDQMVEQFRQRAQMILAMSPEGTRSKLEYWKSGFYHIAHKAKVPIAMATLDYKNKTVRFGSHFMPSGDIHKDMELIRAFFEKIQGKNPELQGPIRVKS